MYTLISCSEITILCEEYNSHVILSSVLVLAPTKDKYEESLSEIEINRELVMNSALIDLSTTVLSEVYCCQI